MPDQDPVGDLRGHIDAAHAAADRLVREAQARAEASDRAFRERLADVPPRGWEVGSEHQPAEPPGHELQAVVGLLEAVRHAIPAELSTQLAEALRELLLALRALIDWYLERLEHAARPEGAPDDRVEDIPIR